MPARLLQLDDVRQINSPEKVASLFHKIGYNAAPQQLAVDDLELPCRSAEVVGDSYLIADHQRGSESLQVLLFQLHKDEWVTPSVASNRMRSIAQSLCRRPSNYLLLGTKDYDQLMLVNPRKSFNDDLDLKVNIRKLLIDRANPTNYDRDRLEAIAARSFSPQELYKVQCEAFDVEKLTKEFYKGYREIFEVLQQVIKTNNPHSYFNDPNRLHQFSQRLLGRIMFLYFLQKKEFLAGDRSFLKTQYSKLRSDLEDTDFYAQVLEPLFFEMLNKQRPNMESPWGKIPYLNGGLFERDYGNDVIDTAGVETPPQIELPNSLFDPSSEKGILKFFNSYNFTVSENVQGDEDVAVDPEMLGKVFENMLAAEERGQSGTFYTPRPIVQFMCVESLSRYLADETGMDLETVKKLTEFDPELPDQDINQLLTKEQAKNLKKALDSVKVCDPAVGSGAFPMGMMQVILSVKQAIARREGMTVERGSLAMSQWKRDIIANNLYGVDIKPEAVEIAKLRMWLSLVVDVPSLEDVEPLPNLDYKLMYGDSLISTIHGERLIPDPTKDQQIMLNVTPIQSAIQPLIDLQHQYFEAHAEERKVLRGKILEAEKNVFRISLADRRSFWSGKQQELERKIKVMKGKVSKATDKERQQIADKLTQLDKLAADVEKGLQSLNFFQWHLHFNEVFQQQGGFDVVIGNPPYVGQKGNKAIFEEIKKSQVGRFYQRNCDIFYFFFHLALDILRAKGYTLFITTNYYLNADSAKTLRKDFKNRAVVLNLINFNELRIFQSAKGQHNLITVLQKDYMPKAQANICTTKRKGDATNDILYKIFNESDPETIFLKKNQTDLYETENNYIRLSENLLSSVDNSNCSFSKISPDFSADSILNQIKNRSNTTLGDVCFVGRGLQTGADKVTKKHISQGLISSAFNNNGIYILSKYELQSLNLPKSELEIVKPFFKNSDIKQYYCKSEPEKYVLYLTRDIDIDNYPKIYNHLQKYEKIINSRSPNRGEIQAALQQGKWWVLFSVKSESLFNSKKLICPQRATRNCFAYTDLEWYSSCDVYYIAAKDDALIKVDLLYLLGILNSKLYYLWLYLKGKRKGNNLELYCTPLKEIPIYVPEKKQQQEIIKIVRRIIAEKSSNISADVSALETAIDEKVAHLYGLTDEEMKIIVEGKL